MPPSHLSPCKSLLTQTNTGNIKAEERREKEMQELLERKARIFAEIEAARIAAELEELRNRKTVLQKIQLFFVPCVNAISYIAATSKAAMETKEIDGKRTRNSLK